MLNLGLGLLGPRRVVVVLYGHRVEESVVYGVQVHHMRLLLQLVDEGEKEETLQTIEIEVLRRPIRCEEHYELVIPERLKQALEYHRVGNVQHLKLVDT